MVHDLSTTDNECMTVIHRPPATALTPDQCLELLRKEYLGRVAITYRALPVVVPVHYRILDGSVVFLTTEGSTLAGATKGSVVAFEVDHSSEDGSCGWSVLIQGIAQHIVDPDELRVANQLTLASWLSECGADHFVRIHPDFVTGRAFASDRVRRGPVPFAETDLDHE
jgi:uncharacterized protein